VSPGRAARALAAGSLGRLFKRLGAWRGVLVMNHHRIGDRDASPFDRSLWSSTAESFDGQVRFLAREADVILPGELEDALRNGRGRHVLLTFDDGYRDNYEIAYPILRSHGVRACFFVATGFLDGARPAWWDEIAWMARRGGIEPIRPLTEHYKQLPGDEAERYLDRLAVSTGAGRYPGAGEWMTWDMVREMRDGGMEIGGHTVTHPVLSRVPKARQDDEIAGCAKRLEEELGRPMRFFSYPNGTTWSFDQGARAALEAHDVELAFSFYGGFLRPGPFDRHDVPRCAVYGHWSPTDFVGATVLPQAFARA
jgi:peptidoglycan/xylan/chitin deacetylase (PgdA/CDA1 family)